MSVSPDTDAIYVEAIDLQSRVEEYEHRRQEFVRLQRDKALELITNGYLPEAAPEIRIEAARLRANQVLQQEHADLFEYLDGESAAFAGITARNESIVAAGWAENFALNAWSRRLREREQQSQGEIEP